MKTRIQINRVYLIVIIGCNIILLLFFARKNTLNNHVTKSANPEFKIPVITQKNNIERLNYFEADHIRAILPDCYGKFTFVDTIDLNSGLDNILDEDFIGYGWRDSLENFSQDGFQIITDYTTHINDLDRYNPSVNCYYPVYIVNENSSTKILSPASTYIFAIQEAKDSNGIWRPIEMKAPVFCGTGQGFLKIHPNEFVVFAMPKYKGGYKTKLRVRIKNEDNILVSVPFDGIINYQQFYLKDDGEKEMMKRNPTAGKKYLFYESMPLEFDIEY